MFLTTSSIFFGDKVEFFLAQGNLQGIFTINIESGNIRVAKSILNHEDFITNGKFDILVKIKDSDGLSATGVIYIGVTDVNEPPQFGPIQAMEVKEGEVTATQRSHLRVSQPKNLRAAGVSGHVASM